MKSKFDRLDRWLIDNWAEAREFETSMERARTTYEGIVQQVVERVQRKLPALDRSKLFGSIGQLVFSKSDWPSASSYLSGLWLGSIGLNNLVVEEDEAPYASFWLDPPKAVKIDLSIAHSKLTKANTRLMKDPKIHWESGKGLKDCDWYYFPETRHSLLKMLLDGSGERFVECLTAHALRLTRFVPIIDQVFRTSESQ